MKKPILIFISLLICFLSVEKLYSQTPVGGKVTDGVNPLPGVNVKVKGTTLGKSTDKDGQFLFDNVPSNAVLVFSFIGYKDMEIPVDNRSQIHVELQEDSQELEGVVIVGYGTQKKENLTGAVSTISAKTLESRPVSNVAQALQGVAPGLNIKTGGELGGSLENRSQINIRGIGSIGEGSSSVPLILIDGMEGDINSLNPQDIENISVLKDAAASSIYGSRAPFGVILITTKSGKGGQRTTINASSSFRMSTPVLLPSMMDSYTFALYFNDARANSGEGAYFAPERMQRIKDFMDGKITTTLIPRPGQPNLWGDGYYEGNDNVDWYKAIYKDRAPSQEYNVNASGGSEDLTYYISGAYLDQTGFMRFGGDDFKRYNTSARIGAKLSEKAKLTYIGRFSREEFERPSYMTNTLNSDIGRQGWPMLPLYDNNGFLYDSPSPALSLRDGGRGSKQSDVLSQQLQLTIEPLIGWKIHGDLSYSISDMVYHWDLQQTFNHDVEGNGYLSKSTSHVHEESSRRNYFNSNIYTEYFKEIGDHSFKVLAGMQSELTKTRFFNAERDGIIVPSLPVLDLTSGNDFTGKTVPPVVSGNNQHWAIEGYFGRLNYNFKERYLLEANLRYDGSSRFRSDKRWIYSPSVSAGWNISREEFWNPIQKYINTLKIRGSYGELSNQNTTNWYPTYVTMPIGSANGSWLVNGARPNTASAPGLISSTLSWEKVRIWNLGTDFSFLDNRITGSFDYYTRYTDNMVGPAPELPVILGTAVPKTNNTDLKTTGFELELGWGDRTNSGFGYTIRAVLSDSKTEITNYPNPTQRLDTYLAGHLAGEIWGYKTLGIAKSQEEMDAHLATLSNGGQNAFGSNWKAGDLMFEDVNGDGKVDGGAGTATDHGDLVLLGNNTPRYSIGLDLGADWKGFDLRMFFQGILKRDYFQNSYYFWGATGSIWNSTGLVEHTDYFRDDSNHPLGLNLDSYYPRPIFNGKNQRAQSKYLQDASYIRLKNLQVGYTISPLLSETIGVRKIRAYVSGENIFTMTSMAKMFDPETIDGGWNGNVYPLSKVYSFGINITL